jgi:uncharacterized protein YidB (DUF937 family)
MRRKHNEPRFSLNDGAPRLLAMAGYQNRDKIAVMLKGLGQGASGGTEQGGLGGLLEQLGGGRSGSSAGWILSGGLAELIHRFKQSGFGDTADSWVRPGPNKQIGPSELEQATARRCWRVCRPGQVPRGRNCSEALARATEAVDKYTPDGRLPAERSCRAPDVSLKS